jgi:ABC-type antimicrobial peptide transport system permease subunit
MWVALSTALRKNIRLGMNIMIQFISLAGLVVLLGILLDFSSVVYNYILPAVFTSAMISITITVIVRRMDLQSFILYFILVALLGFIPMLLIAFHVATILWPSLVSALYAALSLCSLFIFADNATKIELKKRFHL